MSGACGTYRDLIGGYVLDALEPDERDLFKRHLETCDLCARELAELATMPALLDLADSADAVPERPPPRLEEAVLDRLARERRGAGTAARRRPAGAVWRARLLGRRRRPLLAVAGVALACVAVAVVFAAGLIGDQGSGPSRGYHARLSGAALVPGAAGDARLYVRSSGTAVHLRVWGLHTAPGHAYQYELWCVRYDGWRISAGTFRVDGDGRADVHLTTAARPTEYETLSVEAKPASGAGGQPGQRVLLGRIQS